MRVLMCFDEFADPCQALLIDEPVTIDLSAALQAAAASVAIEASRPRPGGRRSEGTGPSLRWQTRSGQ